MASSSSSNFGYCGLVRLEDLQYGVVKTFNPTDSQLVGHYLYNQITMGHVGNGKQAFPDLDIYGESGMEPWAIWDSLEPIRIPHQGFSYFFAKVKKLSSKGTGTRLCRRVGCGGTWSETETVKDVFVDGVQEAFGKLRKFRYENKKETSFGYQHHGAWLLEEYTINHLPELALYRLKVNDKGEKGATAGSKRKRISDESPCSLKNRKLEPKRDQVCAASSSTTTQQQPPQCDNLDYSVDQNLVVSPTGSGLVDDDLDFFIDDEFVASLHQWCEEQQKTTDHSLPVPQQQVEPKELLQQQGEEQLLPSPSLGGDDSLVYGHHDFDLPLVRQCNVARFMLRPSFVLKAMQPRSIYVAAIDLFCLLIDHNTYVCITCTETTVHMELGERICIWQMHTELPTMLEGVESNSGSIFNDAKALIALPTEVFGILDSKL